jgi:hypothetical protein
MGLINHKISSPNDGLGDQLRTGFGNQNLMNTELYQTKVDKITGKGLSTNDYTNTEKTKLAGIAAGAEVNVQSDWEQNDDAADDFIKNKPTIPDVSFSAIYIERFIANGTVNTFTLPIGAQVMNLFVDRGIRYNITEWNQTDEVVTVLGDILQSGTDVYITGMQA